MNPEDIDIAQKIPELRDMVESSEFRERKLPYSIKALNNTKFIKVILRKQEQTVNKSH